MNDRESETNACKNETDKYSGKKIFVLIFKSRFLTPGMTEEYQSKQDRENGIDRPRNPGYCWIGINKNSFDDRNSPDKEVNKISHRDGPAVNSPDQVQSRHPVHHRERKVQSAWNLHQ